jgi:TatD DNase family protein
LSQLIDTHCHLNLGQYETDQAEIIEEALKAGVNQIVTPGVTFESFSSALALNKKYPGILFCALGIHPTEAQQFTSAVYTQFFEASTLEGVVAIGETGLDYYWDQCSEETQHHSLRQHIQLAKQTQLPLILHIRDKQNSERAYKDILKILQEEQAHTVGGVMHCFSGTLDFAHAAIALNFKIAFGGVLTFKNAHRLQEVAQVIDLQHIVLETDSPWLTPEPYRGKRNSPAYIKPIAEKLAQLRHLSFEEIAEITTHNARVLFKLR